LKKINLIWFISIIGIACNNSKNITGTFNIEKNSIVNIELNLNEDNSFVQYVHSSGCEPKFFFGFYKRKGHKVHLDQISENLGHLNKQDTAIFNLTKSVQNKVLYLYYNEQRPLFDAQVYGENGRYIGKADKEGKIIISNDLEFDSIVVKTGVHRPRSFKVASRPFNQIFIMMYDYTFEDCSNFSFEDKFIVSKKGLKYYPNWERVEKPKPVYLRRTLK